MCQKTASENIFARVQRLLRVTYAHARVLYTFYTRVTLRPISESAGGTRLVEG